MPAMSEMLSPAEISAWSPRTQALAAIMECHFQVFNQMEAERKKRKVGQCRKALRSLERAAQHIYSQEAA